MKHMVYRGYQGDTFKHIYGASPVGNEYMLKFGEEKLSDRSLQRTFLRDRKDVEDLFGGKFVSRKISSDSEGARQIWVYAQHGYIPTEIPAPDRKAKRKKMLLLLLGLEMAGSLVPGLRNKAKHLQGRFENSIDLEDAEIAQKIVQSLAMNIGVADAVKQDVNIQRFYLEIIQAIQEERVLLMKYDNPEERKEETVFLAPWEIFFEHHDWYFRGADLVSQEGREYRLTRILSLEELLDGKYLPMPEHVKESFGRCSKRIPLDPQKAASRQKTYTVSLLIDGPFADSVNRICSFPGERKEWVIREGRKVLSYQVEVEDLWEISKWVLCGASCMKILEPEKLRQRVIRDLQKLIEVSSL